MSKLSLYPRLAIAISTSRRLCIHAWSSLYPHLAISISTPGCRCIHTLYKVLKKNTNPGIRRRYSHTLPSLYPHLAIFVSAASRHCIHALYKFFFKKMQTPKIATGMLYLRWGCYYPSLLFKQYPNAWLLPH